MAIVDENTALQLLQKNEVVALPTETVYGLAGRIDSDEALKKIFSTKSRPFFDPLIVHVTDIQQAQGWAEFDEVSLQLAKSFWPGPLTLVLPKKEKVSDLITNGGPTVALRSPNHAVFQNILTKLKVPLAAPSANMFGKTSPTQAQHVEHEFGGAVAVVDGGECDKGIESTVVEVDPHNKKLKILRPGMIDHSDLQEFIKKNNLSFIVETQTQSHAPGHLKNHYQPTSPLVLVKGITDPAELNADAMAELKKLAPHWQRMPVQAQASVAARALYSQLREFSQKQQPFYIVIEDLWLHQPQWAGYLDRIDKASTAILEKKSGQWQLSHNS